VTLDRPSDDPQETFDRVLSESRRIKQWKLGLYFLGGLGLASHVPTVMRWALGRNRSLATAVFSNVGRFVPDKSLKRHERWRCGDAVLERISGVPPLRKLTRAAMIALEYAGELTLCLRCDPHTFDAAATRDLLTAMVEQVRETLRRGY
jgi:hypothetical protein